MSDIVPTQELDCRNMQCPMPVIKTKKALKLLNSGDILKVVATDPGSVLDMASLSRQIGHQIIEQSDADGLFIFYFRKT